jgi:lipopolysaccharide export system protein LptA
LLLSFALLAKPEELHAQVTSDSTQVVDILNYTKRLTFKTVDDSTQLTIISGNVKLRQGTTLFWCDSCVINNRTNVFEAWGKVHINDSDTANVYANHLLYLMHDKKAYLDGNVKLTDGKGTLTTPDLEYDMNTNVGIYTHGGRVVNRKSVLTSQEGWYYADLKDIYFKKNVVLKDPAYTIQTDSLLYNTQTQTTRFISFTTITDSTGRIIKTREGYYNQQTGKAEFGLRPFITDPKAQIDITGDSVSFDDSSGISIAKGNAIVVDKKNQTTIIAGVIFRNKKTEAILATRKPLMIIKQENDSLYITADTLFSARLTDLYRYQQLSLGGDSTIVVVDKSIGDRPAPDTTSKALADDKRSPDTVAASANVNKAPIYDSVGKAPIHDTTAKAPVKTSLLTRITAASRKPAADSTVIATPRGPRKIKLNESDSSNRYFEAYRHVRIFNDSLQAVCDSLFYSFQDSVFRLYDDPVVWAQQSQMTGDTILLYTKNKKADRIQAFENSFLVNKMDSAAQAFNQVRSTRMDGYFKNGDIDSVRARGNAQSIYYITDDDSAYTGINESKSDVMDIYFRNKELFKVVLRSSVTGTLWPIRQKSPSEMRLPNFRWLDNRRPKSKFEMFE